MGRIAKKISLKMLMALAIMILIPVSVYAKPSSDNVGSDKWFSSGRLDLKINQFKNGKEVTYTSGHIDISRSQAPDWDDAKDNSFEWGLKLTNSDGKLRLKKSKANSKKTVAFTDPYYMHEADYSWTGYYGFQIDFDMKMPKGYRYKVDSLKADTLNVDANGANRRAMMIYFPKASYETFSDKDEMRKNTLVIHGTNMGIMTLNETIYTNNAIELTLEPNETNISYDANGGSGEMADQKVTYEKNAKIQENGFKRTGYTFNGWNTKKDGSGKSYAEGADVTKAFPAATSVKLYAQWKEIKISSISLNKTKIVAAIDNPSMLSAKLKPENAYNKTVRYTSSNADVVTVDREGRLKFTACGNAEITAKTSNGLTAKCRVTVYSPAIDDYVKDIKGFTKEKVNLLDHAYPKSSIMRSMEKFEYLSIIGECESYYYIKADKDKKYGFVLRPKIEIPVVGLKINKKSFTLERGLKKKLKVTLMPMITTQRKVSWSSDNTAVATVTKTGQILAKAKGTVGISASVERQIPDIGAKRPGKKGKVKYKKVIRKLYSHGKVDEPNRAWIKLGKVKKAGGTANGMQGLTGLNNNLYYFKVKKKDGVEKYAELYTAKIKKKSIEKEHLVGRLEGRFHCNSIAVKKYKGCTEVYFTENKDTRGQIRRKVLDKNDEFINSKIDTKKIDTIKCEGFYKEKKKIKKNGKTVTEEKKVSLQDRNFHSLAYNGKYFILKSGRNHYVCTLNKDRNKLLLRNVFTAVNVHIDKENKKKTSIQGSSCTVYNKKYYYICYAYIKKVVKDNKLLFELLSGKSYVYRYTLKNASSIKGGGLKTGKKKVYELIANGKVPWKRGGKSKLKKKYKKDGVKNPCAKLEVEGVYIYQGVAYFMTEGGTYCADIKGKFTP